MPQPTLSDVHVNRPLTNISVAFMQSEPDFVAMKVFPKVPVQKESDRIIVYPKGQWFRNQAKKRAPGAESAGSGFDIENTLSYNTERFSIHQDVPNRVRDNSDAPIALERDASRFTMSQIMLAQEIDWTNQFFTTSIWTGSTTGGDITPGNLWDTATGDPIVDIRNQIRSVKSKTGYRPNKIVFSRDAWDAVIDNPNVLSRVNGGSTNNTPAIVTRNLMAQLLELKEVLISDAVVNSATEGATDSIDFVAGKDVLLAYSADSPSILAPTAGYSFVHTGRAATIGGVMTKRFPIVKEDAVRVESEMDWDFKVIASELGVFFNNVVS